MGVVYAAYDELLDRKVALKLLHHDGGRNDDRLLREAQAMARLSHPNIVSVFEVVSLGAQHFIAMEFVRGQSLDAWLAAKARGWQEVLPVLLASGRGLAAAHRAGIVHRDYKPHNTLVGVDGSVKVADFGLARAFDTGEVEPAPVPASPGRRMLQLALTRAGAVLGTPAYMAPEQHAGLACDERSDQFSFCVTAYEALYGAPPFPRTSVAALRAAIERGEVQAAPPGATVPAWLRRAVVRGLAADPARRYPSMDALLDALAQDPARAPPPPPHRPVRRRPGRVRPALRLVLRRLGGPGLSRRSGRPARRLGRPAARAAGRRHARPPPAVRPGHLGPPRGPARRLRRGLGGHARRRLPGPPRRAPVGHPVRPAHALPRAAAHRPRRAHRRARPGRRRDAAGRRSGRRCLAADRRLRRPRRPARRSPAPAARPCPGRSRGPLPGRPRPRARPREHRPLRPRSRGRRRPRARARGHRAPPLRRRAGAVPRPRPPRPRPRGRRRGLHRGLPRRPGQRPRPRRRRGPGAPDLRPRLPLRPARRRRPRPGGRARPAGPRRRPRRPARRAPQQRRRSGPRPERLGPRRGAVRRRDRGQDRRRRTRRGRAGLHPRQPRDPAQRPLPHRGRHRGPAAGADDRRAGVRRRPSDGPAGARQPRHGLPQAPPLRRGRGGPARRARRRRGPPRSRPRRPRVRRAAAGVARHPAPEARRGPRPPRRGPDLARARRRFARPRQHRRVARPRRRPRRGRCGRPAVPGARRGRAPADVPARPRAAPRAGVRPRGDRADARPPGGGPDRRALRGAAAEPRPQPRAVAGPRAPARGRACRALGRHDEALVAIEAAVAVLAEVVAEDNPRTAEALALLGLGEAATGRRSQARAHLERAEQIYAAEADADLPALAQVRFDRAVLLADDDPEAARRLAEAALTALAAADGYASEAEAVRTWLAAR
ncbi:serine/threonine-protein kinase [Nannocystis pusilla]|uniref:serine/threonine-protein kinase n=1 Tax=Nannocystis pusilla TaxID=889268 RepID=UPI003B80CFB9